MTTENLTPEKVENAIQKTVSGLSQYLEFEDEIVEEYGLPENNYIYDLMLFENLRVTERDLKEWLLSHKITYIEMPQEFLNTEEDWRITDVAMRVAFAPNEIASKPVLIEIHFYPIVREEAGVKLLMLDLVSVQVDEFTTGFKMTAERQAAIKQQIDERNDFFMYGVDQDYDDMIDAEIERILEKD